MRPWFENLLEKLLPPLTALLALLALALLSIGNGFAQSYPSRAISVMVPFAAGGDEVRTAEGSRDRP
ncbi:MAG: hypothetical protein WCS09_17655 [Pseudomonadota bacterium]